MIKYLYKYRPDDIYTIKLLCEQRLHFSHPFDFNDPFDCKPLCVKDVSDEDIIDQFKRNFPKPIAELVKTNIGSIQNKIKNGDVQNLVNGTLNWNYVCCFSYNADIPAMWAHYAQNHYGLCLGFDKEIGGAFLESRIKGVVRYTDQQTEFDWTKLDPFPRGNETKNFFFEKAKEWEYEQEYRVVIPHSIAEIAPDTYDSFKKEALVAMFFGLRMPKERQDFYINLCKLCGLNNVTFFKMTMPTDGTYHLKPEKIEVQS